jgi:hypothetical protein
VDDIFGLEACEAVIPWGQVPALVAAVVALGFAVPSVVMALAHSPRALRFAFLALALSAVPVGIGAVARYRLRETVDRELPSPGRSPEEREFFRIAGYHAADDCLVSHSVPTVFPALFSFIALRIVFREESKLSRSGLRF